MMEAGAVAEGNLVPASPVLYPNTTSLLGARRRASADGTGQARLVGIEASGEINPAVAMLRQRQR